MLIVYIYNLWYGYVYDNKCECIGIIETQWYYKFFFHWFVSDCSLVQLVYLTAETMWSRYSCLWWFVRPYFDAMSSLLMVALSRSGITTSAGLHCSLPCIPAGCRVHAMGCQIVAFLTSIRPSITWYHVRQCDRPDLNLEIWHSVFYSSWSNSRTEPIVLYREIMPHHKGYFACIID